MPRRERPERASASTAAPYVNHPPDNPRQPAYGTLVSAFRRHLNCHRWPAAWLVLLALAVRLIVPAGYMPMAGKAALEICAGQTADLPFTASTPVIAPMAGMASMHAMPAMKGMDHGKSVPGDHDHDCGFGAAIGGAAHLAAVILPPLPAPVTLIRAFVRQFMARPGLGLAAPPPPKTGPPIRLR